jgi:hypothetical protein
VHARAWSAFRSMHARIRRGTALGILPPRPATKAKRALFAGRLTAAATSSGRPRRRIGVRSKESPVNGASAIGSSTSAVAVGAEPGVCVSLLRPMSIGVRITPAAIGQRGILRNE